MKELESELIESWALEREVVLLKAENKRLKDERDALFDEVADVQSYNPILNPIPSPF